MTVLHRASAYSLSIHTWLILQSKHTHNSIKCTTSKYICNYYILYKCTKKQKRNITKDKQKYSNLLQYKHPYKWLKACKCKITGKLTIEAKLTKGALTSSSNNR